MPRTTRFIVRRLHICLLLMLFESITFTLLTMPAVYARFQEAGNVEFMPRCNVRTDVADDDTSPATRALYARGARCAKHVESGARGVHAYEEICFETSRASVCLRASAECALRAAKSCSRVAREADK